MAVTVFFRRFPLLSALPPEDVVGGLALPSEGGAEGIMNVQFEMLPKNCWQLWLCCSLMYVGLRPPSGCMSSVYCSDFFIL